MVERVALFPRRARHRAHLAVRVSSITVVVVVAVVVSDPTRDWQSRKAELQVLAIPVNFFLLVS